MILFFWFVIIKKDKIFLLMNLFIEQKRCEIILTLKICEIISIKGVLTIVEW
jgi:hypothetical protein